MNERIAQAQAALKAATDKAEELKRRQRDEINEAQRKIEVRDAPAMAAAHAAIDPAQRALNDLLYEEGAKHPWIGRQVHRPIIGRGVHHARSSPAKTAILEAFKPGDAYSGGTPPKAGELTLRILKSDGERSMQTETYWTNKERLPRGYAFIDTHAAEQRES